MARRRIVNYPTPWIVGRLPEEGSYEKDRIYFLLLYHAATKSRWVVPNAWYDKNKDSWFSTETNMQVESDMIQILANIESKNIIPTTI